MGREPNDRSELPPLRCHGPRQQPILAPRVPKEAITSRDVLLGRSNCSTKHIGTIAFRACVASRLELYKKSHSKSSKTHQIVSVVNSVHDAGGRFMVDVGFGLWWSEVDRRYARKKVCDTFRDAAIVNSVEKETGKQMDDASGSESVSVAAEESFVDTLQNSTESSL
jgi:hypothetical protein